MKKVKNNITPNQQLIIDQMNKDGRTIVKWRDWFAWRVGHGNLLTSSVKSLIYKGVLIKGDAGDYVLSDEHRKLH